MTDPDPDSPPRHSGAGQPDLIRAIHDEHAPALQRYVLRLTRGDRAFADDVVQESLLRLSQRSGIDATYSSESARAWLHTVSRNLVIDDRRYQREQQTDPVPDRHAAASVGPVIDKRVVSEALRSLSPEHRNVLVRAHYLGQTVAEIAAHEQIPSGTVKSRLHYAFRALRIALDEKGGVR